jgi:hypothetical protein
VLWYQKQSVCNIGRNLVQTTNKLVEMWEMKLGECKMHNRYHSTELLRISDNM